MFDDFVEDNIKQDYLFWEWTRPSFSLGKLGTFSSFQVTHVFRGNFIKMKVIFLKI